MVCCRHIPLRLECKTLWSRLRELSVLGRVQVALLFFSLLFQTVLVTVLFHRANVAIAATASLCVACIGTLLVTIMSENKYTFAALMWLLVLQSALTTAAPIMHGKANEGQDPSENPTVFVSTTTPPTINPTPLPLEICLIAIVWSMALAFGALQVLVRRSWGWHAFKKHLITEAHLTLFVVRQRLHAAVVLDVSHSLLMVLTTAATSFSSSAGCALPAEGNLAPVLGSVSAVVAALIAPQFVIATRKEDSLYLIVLVVLMLLCGCSAGFVAVVSAEQFQCLEPNLAEFRHYGYLSRVIVCASCWLAAVMHLLLIACGGNVRATFDRGLMDRTMEGGLFPGSDAPVDPEFFLNEQRREQSTASLPWAAFAAGASTRDSQTTGASVVRVVRATLDQPTSDYFRSSQLPPDSVTTPSLANLPSTRAPGHIHPQVAASTSRASIAQRIVRLVSSTASIDSNA